MIKKLQLLIHFAKNIWVATLSTNLVMWGLIQFDTGRLFMFLAGYFLFIKIIVNALIYALVEYSIGENYLFYQNLGFTKLQLWLFTFTFDCLIFVFIFNIVAFLK